MENQIPGATTASPDSVQNAVPLFAFVPGAVDEEQQRAKADADAKAKELAQGQAKSSLLSFLDKCLNDARDAKQQSGVTDKLLEAQRRRKGEHSPEKIAQLKKYNLPVYWVPITQTKCIHTEAWLRDLLMPYADKTWKLFPTDIPELQADEKEMALQAVKAEATEHMMAGGMASDIEIDNVIKNVEEALKKALMLDAKDKASNMEKLIQDQLEECDFRSVFREFQANLTTYGTAFLKGPFSKMTKSPKWNGIKRVVSDKLIPSCSSPSPHDIFPAPWAKNEKEGYIVECIRTYRDGLSSVRKLEYYETEEIEALLAEKLATSSTSIAYGDQERNIAENKATTPSDDRIECHLFTGPVAGSLLNEWGKTEYSAADDYNMEILWSSTHILKVIPLWDEVGTKQYFRACFKEIPGSFWGIGVPLLMSASQDRANLMMISLIDNANWGTGFIGWINQLRLVNLDDARNMHSKKWIATQASSNPGDNGPPMGAVQLELHVAELNAMYQVCLTDADNESGVPAYMYGSGASGGAGGNYSALTVLMNAAARGIKDALLSIDEALSRFVSFWADYNNEYSKDESVKGDIRVVCSGATGLFVQELQLSKLTDLANEAKEMIPVTGPRFVIDILRQKAKILKADVTLLPTDDELKALESNKEPPKTETRPTINVSVKWELLTPEEKQAFASLIPELEGAGQPAQPAEPIQPELDVGSTAGNPPAVAPGQPEEGGDIKPIPPVEQQ